MNLGAIPLTGKISRKPPAPALGQFMPHLPDQPFVIFKKY
jgi:hypothetical protein